MFAGLVLMFASSASAGCHHTLAQTARQIQSFALARPTFGVPAAPTGTDDSDALTLQANCSAVWKNEFEEAAGQDDDALKSVCSGACESLGRTVQSWGLDAAGQDHVCICNHYVLHHGHSDESTTDDVDKNLPCAVAGMNGGDATIFDCKCPAVDYRRYFPLIVAVLYGIGLTFFLLVSCVNCCAQTTVCLVGCTKPVSDENDVHWAKCCCPAGGAFCCIPQMNLPAVRMTTMSLYLLLAVEMFASSMGFTGLGIGLIGLAATAAPPAHRNAYYKVGLAYFCAVLLMGLLYISIIGIGAALVLQVFVSWCYICTLSALVRLPCKRAYKERWLTPNAAGNVAPYVDPEQQPTVVTTANVTFEQLAAAPLLAHAHESRRPMLAVARAAAPINGGSADPALAKF